MDNEHIRYQGIRQEESMTTYYVSMSNGELLILTLISNGIEVGTGAGCITGKRLDTISLFDREFFDLVSHDRMLGMLDWDVE